MLGILNTHLLCAIEVTFLPQQVAFRNVQGRFEDAGSTISNTRFVWSSIYILAMIQRPLDNIQRNV